MDATSAWLPVCVRVREKIRIERKIRIENSAIFHYSQQSVYTVKAFF